MSSIHVKCLSKTSRNVQLSNGNRNDSGNIGSMSIYTETKMSSFWRNFNHWLHWKLSFWQLPVQPVMKISSKWRHFRFSVVLVFYDRFTRQSMYHGFVLCFDYVILATACLRLSQFSLFPISCTIRSCSFSAYPYLAWRLWEYVYFYFIVLSSNRKYEPLTIV